MDYGTLYSLIGALFAILFGFVIGWASDAFNRAKLFRLVGRHKLVVFVVGGQGKARSFLVNSPIGVDAIKIQVKSGFNKIVQELTFFPNPAYNGDYKTIPFGIFDAKDCRQIPLTVYAHYVGKDEAGNMVWRNNMEVLEHLVPPAKVQNILSTNASANRIKARNEQNADGNQKLLLFIAAVCGIVTLLVVLYIAIQVNTNLNISGGVSNFLATQINQTVTYKAT